MEDLVQQGKRDLACREYSKAVTSFQTVCETLSKDHGESAVHLAEPYYYYGCALLEIARIESDVLGNALEGVPEGDDVEDKDLVEEDEKPLTEEEKEKISDEVIDAMCEKEEVTETTETDKDKTGDEEKNTDKDKTEDEEKNTDKDKTGDEEKIDDANAENGEKTEEQVPEEGEADEEEEADGEEGEEEADGEEENESEDDVSSLQLAWEVLELAKKYFSDLTDNEENKLRVSDCLFKLGEIGLEKEDYEQSISDFTECLQIRKSNLGDDSRLLGEVHFQLGVAHGANNGFSQAIGEFELCKQVLERRLQNLESKKVDSTLSEEEKEKIISEIDQIKGLIPEINQRISEANEDRFDYDQIKKTVREGFATVANAVSGFSDSSSNEKADDINHLVRKKRKAEDSSTHESNGSSNGHSVNGHSTIVSANGDSQNGETKKEDLSPVTKKTKISEGAEILDKPNEVPDPQAAEVA